jgi:hypothetical protein
MDTIRFIGYLYPTGSTITASFNELEWKWVEVDKTLKFRTSINNNFANVECDIDEYKNEYLGELHKRAFDIAKTLVNMASFATGEGYILAFETIIFPGGKLSSLRYEHQALANQVRSFGLSNSGGEMSAIGDIILSDIPLMLTLNDLVECTRPTHESATICARVVESLRRQISSNADRAIGWHTLRENLNISESFLKKITNLSVEPRHGDRSFISGAEIADVVSRTWNVMDRYLEYRKRNRTKLTPPQYAELT